MSVDAVLSRDAGEDDYCDVPAEMRRARCWLVYRLEPARQDGGKPSKVPHYISGKRRSGALDTPEDRAQLTTFDDALEALRNGGYAGLGFALGSDGNGGHWQGIDLDDVADHPALGDVIDDLPGYTERSPSGKGFHAVGYGRKFDALAANASGIEAYAAGRYFTVTGTGAGINPPTVDLADFVEQRLKPIHSPRTDGTHTRTTAPPADDDDSWRDVLDALGAIPSDDRNVWIDVGMALQSTGRVDAFDVWDRWSQSSNKYDAVACERTWRSFRRSGITIATVFGFARDKGWRPERKTHQSKSNGSDAQAAKDIGEHGESTDAPLPIVYAHEIGADSLNLPQIFEDVLTAGGLSVMYGASNSGKSYIGLYAACSIARGISCLGKRTTAGVVLFVAGEGAASVKMRIEAYKRHHSVDRFPLAIIPAAVNMLDPLADTQRVIDAARRAEDEFGLSITLTTIDTLARAFGGGNENSSEDMGAVIGNADRIRAETGTHLQFIHHSGKDESKGSRGHSSLRAATDTEIEVTDSGNRLHTCEIVKQRDLGSMNLRLSARFVPMDFGVDQWGKPLMVCVVEDADAVPKPAHKKALGKNQALLLAHIRANGPITLTAAIEYMRAAEVPRSTYRSVIDGLKLAGLVADIAPGGLTAITT